MGTYIIDVHHRDRYKFEANTVDEAIKIAIDCVTDNYGPSYPMMATFDAIRIDIPTIGDMSDAGMEGA
jgi:hypothetical protein